MVARDPRETHRPATTLELLYDLCFVVAIAQAAHGLHHALAHGDGWHAVIPFGLVFFAIWWAWMNFTWFASAFDTDDVPYRLKVLLQMFGLLVLAAGIPRAFADQQWGIVTLGYTIMRVGMIAQWLRAARSPTHRKTARRYAVGLAVVQCGWIALIFLPPEQWVLGWLFLAPAELAVPIWAERAGSTTWHPEHIAERYGLMTIIVIGESVLAGTIAIQTALDSGHPTVTLYASILSAPITLFAMWWLYFLQPSLFGHGTSRSAFLWGYSHYFIFAAAAAVGVSISVTIDHATHQSHVSALTANLALAVPIALFLACLGGASTASPGKPWAAYALAIGLCLASAWLPFAPIVMALVLAALTGWMVACDPHRTANKVGHPPM
jgi:low temperature requirement protein LtrA